MSEIWFCHSVLLFSWNVAGSDVETGIKMQVKICRGFRYTLDIVWADFFWHPAVFVFGSRIWNQGSSLQASMLRKINWHSKQKGFEWNIIHSWMGILQTGYNSGEIVIGKNISWQTMWQRYVFLRILVSNSFTGFPHSPISTKSGYTRVLAEQNYSKNINFFP